MNYKHYLERIGVEGDLHADLATLRRLQYQHLLHIPFENIDIRHGKPIPLNVVSFYNKIVVQRRGGYCYECNGLFHELLLWLGYDSRIISCRVTTGKQVNEQFDHLALIVTLNGTEWLVDVGFGDFSIMPLQTNTDMPQHDHRNEYCIGIYGDIDGELHYAASRMKNGKGRFVPVYLFSKQARVLAEFGGMNAWHQSAPESHFTKQLICSRLTETGRISLISNRLIITNGPDKEEKLLYGTACYDLLVHGFGIPADSLPRLINDGEQTDKAS